MPENESYLTGNLESKARVLDEPGLELLEAALAAEEDVLLLLERPLVLGIVEKWGKKQNNKNVQLQGTKRFKIKQNVYEVKETRLQKS
jgi:hypothetical protein